MGRVRAEYWAIFWCLYLVPLFGAFIWCLYLVPLFDAYIVLGRQYFGCGFNNTLDKEVMRQKLL